MNPLRRLFDITDPAVARRPVIASRTAVILPMFPAPSLTRRDPDGDGDGVALARMTGIVACGRDHRAGLPVAGISFL